MKEEQIIANLSHSYWNKILTQIQPFLKYEIKDIIYSIQSTTTIFDSELLERLVLILCLNTSDISIPFNKIPIVNKCALNRLITIILSLKIKLKMKRSKIRSKTFKNVQDRSKSFKDALRRSKSVLFSDRNCTLYNLFNI